MVSFTPVGLMFESAGHVFSWLIMNRRAALR